MSCSRIVAANHELRTTSFRSSTAIATQGRRLEDKPNYELLDDDNEDMDTMMAAMDHESSFHRSIHKRRPL
ncbi:unnamed protein product [Urochloa humidicola]